jgi:hypothetical protein
MTHRLPLIVVAALAVAGCESSPPTDATGVAIQRTEEANQRAIEHVDKSLELNLEMQRGLSQLRTYQPSK